MDAPDARTPRQVWDERHAARDPIESREPDPSLVGLASRLEPGRALDLAAGDGRNAVWLAARGWSVTGVDFSGVAIGRARDAAARNGASVDWVQADLLDWAPAQASADLVAVVFLHLPPGERRAVLRRAANALAPGGRLLVVGHDRSNAGRDVPGPRDPALLYDPAEVAADLAGLAGLVVEEAGRVERDLGDGRLSADAVVVALRPPA